MLLLALTTAILLVPAAAFAWGPLTHVYLGSEVLSMAPAALPVAVHALIMRYRQDFLYGTIMPDVIMAKSRQPLETHNHSWKIGFMLLEQARSDSERAFCLGYISHLAADVVSHGEMTSGKGGISHAMAELRAERQIHHSHWLDTVAIELEVQRRNDKFLEDNLSCVYFSFTFNRRLFKSIVMLSGLASRAVRKPLMRRHSPWVAALNGYHDEAIRNIVSVLTHGKDSPVVATEPMADLKPIRLLSRLRGKG